MTRKDGLPSESHSANKTISLCGFAANSRVLDRLVTLGEEGMASGIAEDLDIDAFVRAVNAQP